MTEAPRKGYWKEEKLGDYVKEAEAAKECGCILQARDS